MFVVVKQIDRRILPGSTSDETQEQLTSSRSAAALRRLDQLTYTTCGIRYTEARIFPFPSRRSIYVYSVPRQRRCADLG
jgi:hypothetical protein